MPSSSGRELSFDAGIEVRIDPSSSSTAVSAATRVSLQRVRSRARAIVAAGSETEVNYEEQHEDTLYERQRVLTCFLARIRFPRIAAVNEGLWHETNRQMRRKFRGCRHGTKLLSQKPSAAHWSLALRLARGPARREGPSHAG
jgi:hypothetical protein